MKTGGFVLITESDKGIEYINVNGKDYLDHEALAVLRTFSDDSIIIFDNIDDSWERRTISDDFKSVSFSSNVQREGYTLVGFSTGYFSQEEINNATPDMSKPYTIDENGNVHMNLDDIVAWSVTDDIDTNTITIRYHLTTLWAPNPEPEPAPEPEPQPEPEPAPAVPASDATQTPAPRREKSVLPNTGDASSVAGVFAAAGTTLVALGLRRKMQQ